MTHSIRHADRSTHPQDKNKGKTYAHLGVYEYFQFDPFAEYLSPPLQGFRQELALPRRSSGGG